MEITQLLTDIQNKDIDKETHARQVAEEPSAIPDLIAALGHKRATLRYGCAKVLHLLSETHPALLYDYFDDFVQLVSEGNNIMQAEGLYVLSRLAEVDSEERLDGLIDCYLQPIRGPVLMVACNAIQGGARIAESQPHLADRVAEAILGVAEAHYKTDECVRVASGAAVEALDAITHLVADPRPIRKFIHAQADSPRKGTRTRAEKVLRRRGW